MPTLTKAELHIRARDVIALCRDCAASIHGTRPPSPQYAERAAMLLAGTAATESHLKYHRQNGFSYGMDAGAWGLWQTEWPPLVDNITYLANREAVRRSAMLWLYDGMECDGWGALRAQRPPDLCRVAAAWPRFACLMARIHYMRFPEPIPASLRGQAEYWKDRYNTRLGAGTPEKYMADWARLIAPVLADEADT